MKKILSVFTAVCLLLTLCLPCFAASVELADSDPVLDEVSGIVSRIGTVETADDGTEDEFTQDEAIAEIIDKIKGLGVDNSRDALSVADQLYNFGAIDKPEYDALKEAITKDTELDKDAAKNDIIDKVRAIMEDDSLDVTAKAAEIGKLLIGMPIDEVQNILETLVDQGIIDNDMYNRISDVLNNASIEDITNIFNGGGNSALGGITDLISNLLGMLGLGGGDDSGDSGNGGSSGNKGSSSNNGSSNNGSSNSSSNQVPGTKTGDYALVSVLGVTAVAGAAFILTRKKHSKEDNEEEE